MYNKQTGLSLLYFQRIVSYLHCCQTKRQTDIFRIGIVKIRKKHEKVIIILEIRDKAMYFSRFLFVVMREVEDGLN